MSFDWKGLLGKVAPTIATALGGPFAGMATKALASGLLGDEQKSEKEIAEVLASGNTEVLAKLKKIDNEFELRLEELGVKKEELIYQDKASAREMQAMTKSIMPAVLASILTVGFFSVIGTLFMFEVPEANKPLVFTMVGSLGTVWLGSMQFYFGTTKGSGDKNQMLLVRQQHELKRQS